jgi:hypothetical protein
MSSTKVIEQDIQYLTEFNNKILLEVAALTATLLNEKQDKLQHCKWSDGESNTDTDFSELACRCVEETWLQIKQKYPQLNDIGVVAAAPDINCTFSKNGKNIKIPKTKIELKSSKGNTMPGSTIGKLDINQPLIYCRRPKNTDEPYEVRYGQYHMAMGDSDVDLFQDRTPRPPINFTKLTTSNSEIVYSEKKKDDWVSHYGKCAVNRLTQPSSASWQDALTKSILFEAVKDINSFEEFVKFRESLM